MLDTEAAASVEVDDGFLSWAALDRTTGELVTKGERPNTAESMIKPWIVADHLRSRNEDGEEPSDEVLALASRAIRYSDDEAAQELYVAGGGDDVVQRMIDMCGLTETEIYPHWWSRTEMSAEDVVRFGECLVNGTAAGPEWTDWVLNEMRNVRGSAAEEDQRGSEGFEGGRWGIIDGLPPHIDPSDVAIKNGWTRVGDTGKWHLNCLALTPDWVIAVLMRYPATYPLEYGADRCAQVAEQLLDAPPPAG